MEDSKKLSDALVLVQLRNAFYKKKFHFVLGIYALSLMIIAILISIIIFLKATQAKPHYFVADEVGRLMKDIPLNDLNMSSDELLDWAVNAVLAANSFDFINYRHQLQDAQKYFMDESWATYM